MYPSFFESYESLSFCHLTYLPSPSDILEKRLDHAHYHPCPEFGNTERTCPQGISEFLFVQMLGDVVGNGNSKDVAGVMVINVGRCASKTAHFSPLFRSQFG